MLAIEKNIPMPEARTGRSMGYPFAKMKVGDSFLVPLQPRTKTAERTTHRKRVQASMYKAKVSLNYQFALRTTKDGFRVWRVK